MTTECFTIYSSKDNICEDNLLKMTFLILDLRTTKGHIPFTGIYKRFIPGVAILRPTVGFECGGNPLPDINDSQLAVSDLAHQFCWINVQLPSPFLGSPLAQGVRQASLRGWSNSHFSELSRK